MKGDAECEARTCPFLLSCTWHVEHCLGKPWLFVRTPCEWIHALAGVLPPAIGDLQPCTAAGGKAG